MELIEDEEVGVQVPPSTLIKFLTLTTPPVSRAYCSAFLRVSSFFTTPWRTTSPWFVSTSILNGLMSPSAASFALILAVMAASSTCWPGDFVELHAPKDRASISARQMTGTRSIHWFRFMAILLLAVDLSFVESV